jgi:peptidoglycan hydrolase-like protein with peptidoglycan-binding domain
VQKALGVSKTNGVYDTTTALAVMRFQKANGLDVNGVVDGSVRDKLGITLPPTPKMIPKN